MTNRQRSQLRKRLKQTTDAAVTLSVSGGSAVALKALLDEAEGYSKLLAMTVSSWAADSIVALVVGVIVLVVAGLLWSSKVHHSDVTLVANTTRVRVVLPTDWILEDTLQGHAAHLDHLSALHNPSFGISFDDPNASISLQLDGGDIGIQTLKISRGAEVYISFTDNSLVVETVKARLTGTVWVTGNGMLAASAAGIESKTKAYRLTVPETFSFSTAEGPDSKSQMEIQPSGDWSLGNFPSSNLDFAYETRSVTERRALSGIRGGSLQFNNASWPATQLLEDQQLSIADTSQARIRIHRAIDAMRVTLDGPVGRVTLGDLESRRDLAPSYLEYLSNKKSLLLFWTGVAAGWGLLWGIRKTMFR